MNRRVWWQAAGKLDPHLTITQRPLRSPSADVAKERFTGTANPQRPGELALAHNGVLFLNQIADFRRDVLTELCKALDYKRVVLPRLEGPVMFPTSLVVVVKSLALLPTWTQQNGHFAAHRRSRPIPITRSSDCLDSKRSGLLRQWSSFSGAQSHDVECCVVLAGVSPWLAWIPKAEFDVGVSRAFV